MDATTSDREAVERGLEAKLRLHKFKRGPVRGTFLWPLLAEFPDLPVTALDVDARRASDLEAIRVGGVSRLSVHRGNVCTTELGSGSADVVTALEVLEHIPTPTVAARQLVRLARRAVIVSVPSKADENPEHLHLFDNESIARLFVEAGAEKVSLEFVLNHRLAFVRVRP